MIDYKKETRDAYLTPAQAARYKRYNSIDWTWGRFVTWLELRAVVRELGRYKWTSSDQLLDIPAEPAYWAEYCSDSHFGS